MLRCIFTMHHYSTDFWKVKGSLWEALNNIGFMKPLKTTLCFSFQTRHGHGQMMFSSGAVYDGQWQYDKMTGYGTLKLPDGTIQEGTWKEGSLQGCALFTWPHGVTEYREYDTNRGRLHSQKLSKYTLKKDLSSDFKMQKNKLRYKNVLLKVFRLNGHTVGFQLSTESHSTA